MALAPVTEPPPTTAATVPIANTNTFAARSPITRTYLSRAATVDALAESACMTSARLLILNAPTAKLPQSPPATIWAR